MLLRLVQTVQTSKTVAQINSSVTEKKLPLMLLTPSCVTIYDAAFSRSCTHQRFAGKRGDLFEVY